MDMVRRRVVAYLIDMIIVSLIMSIIVSNNYNNNIGDKLIKINDKYASEKIDAGEYLKEYSVVLYKYNKSNFGNNLIYLIIMVGYFVVFVYLNNGSSIGKKLMRIRIVDKNGNKLNIWRLIVRVLLINEVLSLIGLILFTMFLEGYSFMICYGFINLIGNILFIICCISMFINKDRLGLHDRICGSEVVKIK